jgi:hypothetical protein
MGKEVVGMRQQIKAYEISADSMTEHIDSQSFKGMDKYSVTPYFLPWI